MSAVDEQSMIERHIAVEALGNPAEARLRESGVHVWALIGHWRANGYDVDELACSYQLPRDAVDAAISFYCRHAPEINGRLAANDAA